MLQLWQPFENSIFNTINPKIILKFFALSEAVLFLKSKFIMQARYRQSLDPTVDDIKRLCTSLRRNAKEERVLFHYNGHGVPRPTTNGEIWVFNKVDYHAMLFWW